MTLEHAPEDEVPHRAVREPRELDEHDRPRRFVLTEVGEAAARVDVADDVELLAEIPERLVVRVPQRQRARSSGGTFGSRIAAEDVHVLLGPADLVDRVVDVVQEDLREPGAPAGRRGAEVGEPAVVRLQPGPPALVVLGRSARAR